MAAMRKSAAPTVRPRPAITTRQTKSEIIGAIAGETGLTHKEVTAVFTALGDLVERHMKRRGSGEFTIPDTGVRIRRVKKPARKARVGRNPATGEAMRIPAKPASATVKLTALKSLKDSVRS